MTMLFSYIIRKTIIQLLLGSALSCLYMLIRPHPSYTLAWPFAFLASWFFLVAWFVFLKHDGVAVLNLSKNKKRSHLTERFFKKFKTRSFIDYVDSEVENEEILDDNGTYHLKLFSNLLTGFIFLVLTIIF